MNTLKIIYWNIKNNTNINIIIELIDVESPDILILSECSLHTAKDLAQKIDFNIVIPILDKKPKTILLHNLKMIKIYLKQEYKNRMNIYKIGSPELSIILISLHLPSKIRMDRVNQLTESVDYMQQVINIEKAEMCNNSIIIGDFNMNPFDDGMIAGNGFNSVISENIALTKTRTISRKKYEYFYNPAWKIYGNSSEKLGTFFLQYPNHSSFHWNIYDQAIIRPALLEKYYFKYSPIEDDKYFCIKGLSYSDHSPIIAKIERRE